MSFMRKLELGIERILVMADQIATGGVHHLKITVADVERSQQFYTGVLDFQYVADLPSGVFLSNGNIGLGIGTPPDPSQADNNDRFNENRVGLDHLSFNLESRAALDKALQTLDEHNVDHGEIKDLGADFGICVLAFRDPDNIQLELTAPRG